jgi:hypothetical protein
VTRSLTLLLRRLLFASAAATTTACTSVYTENGPGPRTPDLPNGRRDEVLLTLKDGREIRMFHPTIAGDSVVGATSQNPDSGALNIAVAKADIATVSVWRTNAGKTTLAVFGGTVAALTILVLGTCAALASSY